MDADANAPEQTRLPPAAWQMRQVDAAGPLPGSDLDSGQAEPAMSRSLLDFEGQRAPELRVYATIATSWASGSRASRAAMRRGMSR